MEITIRTTADRWCESCFVERMHHSRNMDIYWPVVMHLCSLPDHRSWTVYHCNVQLASRNHNLSSSIADIIFPTFCVCPMRAVVSNMPKISNDTTWCLKHLQSHHFYSRDVYIPLLSHRCLHKLFIQLVHNNPSQQCHAYTSTPTNRRPWRTASKRIHVCSKHISKRWYAAFSLAPPHTNT